MDNWLTKSPFEKENRSEDGVEIWKLRDDKHLANFITAVEWPSFVTFVTSESPVWLTSDCCVGSGNSEVPSHYTYLLDMVVRTIGAITIDEEETITIQIAGADANATSSTITNLLQWLIQRDQPTDVTLKAFARQPRQELPPLETMEVIPNKSALKTLRLHFIALLDPSWSTLIHSVSDLEIRQSTVEEWSDLTSSKALSKLTVSCAMPEFSKFALSPLKNVTELSLQLHFWLQGSPMESFCQSLRSNETIRSLSIQYLDISDECWTGLMTSLSEHPKLQSLSLLFTDNFVDNYRRLTPERRKMRSEAVLDLVRVNQCICNITFPDFQRDEAVMDQVDELLKLRDNIR